MKRFTFVMVAFLAAAVMCITAAVAIYVVMPVVGANTITPGRWARYEHAGAYIGVSPSCSSDGTYIVFSSPLSGQGDIYRLRVSDCQLDLLASSPEYEGDTRYSPDGKSICFMRENSGYSHIWVMDADGLNQRQLTRGNRYDLSPSFSPDGHTIVFSGVEHADRFTSNANCELHSISLDSNHVEKLAFTKRTDSEPSFSPDGKWILHSDWSNKISVLCVKDGTRKVLGLGCSPSSSSDGSRIVFITDDRGYGAGTIAMMNPDGSGFRNVLTSNVYKTYPSFMPDGRILYLEGPWPIDAIKKWLLCTILPDGTDRSVLYEFKDE